MTAIQWPRLTVLIVCRNAEATIARALDSVELQHYPNLELIVLDGASDDSTCSIIERYRGLLSFFESKPDKGNPDATNQGIALAQGDYIGFLNADDEYEPGALWAVAHAIKAAPQAEVVSFGQLFKRAEKTGLRITGLYASPTQLRLDFSTLLTNPLTFINSRFYTPELLRRAGPMNIDRNRWFLSTDREYLLRLALLQPRQTVLAKPLYGFYAYDTSLSNNPANLPRILREHLMIANHFLARNDITPQEKALLTVWKRRQIAWGLIHSLLRRNGEDMRFFVHMAFQERGWPVLAEAVRLTLRFAWRKAQLRSNRVIDAESWD